VLLHPACPHAPRGPELRDLLEEVDVGVEEERQLGAEDVHIEAALQTQLHVGEPVGEGERKLLRRRGTGFPDVVAGDGYRVIAREMLRAVLHHVPDQPQMWTRRVHPLLLRDVLLEDVRLARAVERFERDTLLLRDGEIEAKKRGRRARDRHRYRNIPQRDALEEAFHVAQR
jgi:hypothetical protein